MEVILEIVESQDPGGNEKEEEEGRYLVLRTGVNYFPSSQDPILHFPPWSSTVPIEQSASYSISLNIDRLFFWSFFLQTSTISEIFILIACGLHIGSKCQHSLAPESAIITECFIVVRNKSYRLS